MPRLPYKPEQFGRYMGPAFTGPGDIYCSWSEVCRAAITVGRRNWTDVLRFGTYSALECLWRLAMVRANLVEQVDGRLRKSSAFVALDPSEKGAVSYFFGLVFTKLIAEKLFGVPWLLHYDVYSQYLNATLGLNVRPDFVGMNASQQWVVLESKGRSDGASENLLVTAKRQTRSIRRVRGQLPTLRAAVATYFSSGKLRARVRDPEEFDADGPDLLSESDPFLRAYYCPLVELLEASPHERREETIEGRGYVRADLSGFDASVSIDEEVLKWYHSPPTSWETLRRRLPDRVPVLTELSRRRSLAGEASHIDLTPNDRQQSLLGRQRLREELRVGLDGVTVELGASWNSEYMRREPTDRAR